MNRDWVKDSKQREILNVNFHILDKLIVASATDIITSLSTKCQNMMNANVQMIWKWLEKSTMKSPRNETDG